MKIFIYISKEAARSMNYGALMFSLGQKYRRSDTISVYTEAEADILEDDLKTACNGDRVVAWLGDRFYEQVIKGKDDRLYN